jgi:ribosome-binding factor A
MPRPQAAGARGPSQRQLRVGEIVRHALSDVLTRAEVPDPVLETHVITVPEVRMSPDLKLATAYVMPLGGVDADKVLAALSKNARGLRRAVAPRIDLKFMPELRFLIDTSFEEGARIDALLRSDEVRRDVEAGEEDDTDDDRR